MFKVVPINPKIRGKYPVVQTRMMSGTGPHDQKAITLEEGKRVRKHPPGKENVVEDY